MFGGSGPSGGFCNYGVFGIEGKDAATGKRKYKKLSAVSEAAAQEKAAALGCVGPYKVEVCPFTEPTDRQLRYGASLGVVFPEGCNSIDASALIGRAEENDPQDPDPGLVAYAEGCGVCFSRLVSEAGLVGCMVSQLEPRERAIFFAYAVSRDGSGLGDPRQDPKFPAFCRFADMAGGDPSLAKSVEGREAREYLAPGRNTKAYKIAASCL